MKTTQTIKKQSVNIWPAVMLSLTLGLAPFVPEPHILGKIRWVMGGAVGMQPMDYFDLVLHGTPWVFLIVLLTMKLVRKFR